MPVVSSKESHRSSLPVYTNLRSATYAPTINPVATIWLKQPGPLRLDSSQLIDDLATRGITIEVEDFDGRIDPAWATADIIFLEAGGLSVVRLQNDVAQVRSISNSPLIIVACHSRDDQGIAAIQAGADAVISPKSAPEVIFARCTALLRRWQSSRVSPKRLVFLG